MRRLAPAICVCATALGGCGGDDDAPKRTVRVDTGDGVRVIAEEYYFDPNGVVATGGGQIEITLDNRGSLAHNVKVFEGEREIGGTPSFAGGEQRSATVEVSPGKYRLVCTVGDHEEQGMTGALEVRRPGR